MSRLSNTSLKAILFVASAMLYLGVGYWLEVDRG